MDFSSLMIPPGSVMTTEIREAALGILTLPKYMVQILWDTVMPTYSDTAYSDTPLIVTL